MTDHSVKQNLKDAEIPVSELWLFHNETALTQVKQGLEDAEAGRMSSRGSYSKYKNNETD